jgi:hypothetical protein
MSAKRVLVTMLVIVAMAFVLLSAFKLTQAAVVYSDEPTTLTGGQYILTSLDPGSSLASPWRVNGEASGGNYRLAALPAPASTGSGCCCTFLPCITRIYAP